MLASQRSPADVCRWIKIRLTGAPVLLMDVTTQRQGHFIYGSSGAVAQGDATGLPGQQCLAEGQGWVRWQLRVPDFNLQPHAGENPSRVVQPLISQNSHELKSKHLVLGDHPGMPSPVQAGLVGALGFLFGRGIEGAEL